MLNLLNFKIFKKKLLFYSLMFFILIFFFELILNFGGYSYFYVYSNLDNPEIEEGDFRILFLGESTTQGHTLGMENSYPAQVENMLQQQYPNRKIKSYNKGVNAIETTAILRNLDRNMVKYMPNLVILMAGSNDHFILDNKTLDLKNLYSKSKFYRLVVSMKDISKLTSDVRQDDGDFRYVHTPYHYKPINFLSEGIFNFNEIIRIVHFYNSKIWFAGYLQPDAREEVNPLLQKIAEENNIIYIGYYPELDFKANSSLFMYDGWHPNKEGHKIIAEKIVEKIINEGIIDNWQLGTIF